MSSFLRTNPLVRLSDQYRDLLYAEIVMPITVNTQRLPAGRSLQNAHEGDTVSVQAVGYLSTDDGRYFTDFAESIVIDFPGLVGAGGRVAHTAVDTFLAIYDPSHCVTAYCNELGLVATARPNRPIAAGEAIGRNDIVDICGAQFQTSEGNEIEILPHQGFVAIISAGWRKCLYFDFVPLLKDGRPRQESISGALAGILRRLHFGRVFQTDEVAWVRLFSWNFFPFVVLSERQRNLLISRAELDDDPNRLLRDLCVELRETVAARAIEASTRDFFNADRELIGRAVERYANDDFISCVAIAYPRIEGMLRRMLRRRRPGTRVTRDSLCDAALDGVAVDSLLLPVRFRQYLAQFYFQNFDEATNQLPLSRHTIAHGVNRAEDCDIIRATIGLLIFIQIAYDIPA